MRIRPCATTLAALLLSSAAIVPSYGQSPAPAPDDGSALPRPQAPFKGKLDKTEAESTAVFPSQIKTVQGAPNIVLVMTDDVGFAAAGTFGGPIPTPNLDRLAAHGLRYNQFHTTAICSPTRAALLTGRNHHAVSTATVVEMASPYPGYTAVIPRSAATIARILRDNGYSTAMFGKHHNVPNNELSAAGPFDHWPAGLGFEYFYGFVAGDTHQFKPALYQGTDPVQKPWRSDNYILEKDLADHAIDWLHNQKAAAPDKPFFIYYAPGTAHAPHHTPADWIARFEGKFDEGWDKQREATLARQKAMGLVPSDAGLAPRPSEIPAWDSLSAEEKRVYARFMEVYAGMLAYQDAQFGRLCDEIERMGLSGNTLVIFIEGDNGASGEAGPAGTLNEIAHMQSSSSDTKDRMAWLAQNLDMMGGPRSYQGYPAGWAFAMSTPFPWIKQVASHLGGVRNGLVISWPDRIKAQGELRAQYHHVIDIMPTLLEAARVKAPATVDGISQQRIDGTSMAYSFDAGDAPSARRTQYYEMLGNRGIYHDGWLANTTPRNMPWTIAQIREGSDITAYKWELYNLKTDFSQAHDLAAKEQNRLKAMQALFDAEARRNNVYPIQDSGGMSRAMRMAKAYAPFRTNYVYWGKNIRLPAMASPPIFSLPFSIEADIDIARGNTGGVIVGAGSVFGGWSFYLKNGRPVAYVAASQLPGEQFRVAAGRSLSSGPNRLRFDFEPSGQGGVMTISVNGAEAARGDVIHRPRAMAGLGETFDIGHDSNMPVSDEYENEGPFGGEIRKVEVVVKPPHAASSARPEAPLRRPSE